MALVPEGRVVPGNVFERLFVLELHLAGDLLEGGRGASGAGIAITDIDFPGAATQLLGAFLASQARDRTGGVCLAALAPS